MPFVDTLHDDFSGGLALWPDSYGGVALDAGRAVVPMLSSYPALLSAQKWLLQNSAIYAKVTFPPQPGHGTREAFFEFYARNGAVSFYQSGSSRLVLGYRTFPDQQADFDDTPTKAVNTDIAYDATTMAWLRIREANGMLYWETSPDGVTWTQRRSYATGLIRVGYAGRVNFSAGCYGDESPAALYVDQVNLLPRPRDNAPVDLAMALSRPQMGLVVGDTGRLGLTLATTGPVRMIHTTTGATL